MKRSRRITAIFPKIRITTFIFLFLESICLFNLRTFIDWSFKTGESKRSLSSNDDDSLI